MSTVLDWANQNKLPVLVTFEAKDTGRYNLPNELLSRLDSSRTIRYIKYFYDATKHSEFKKFVLNSNVDHWIIIGAETDVCVYQTTKGLLALGKNVTLINDAIYSGRNNTEISINSLVSFGADITSTTSLEHISTTPKSVHIEKPIDFDNVVLSIFPYSDSTDSKNGNIQRIEYLKNFAKIAGLKIEQPDSLRASSKIRIIAGKIDTATYNYIKSHSNNEIIILADAITNMKYTDLPIEWKKHTVKSLFYELMKTVNFYYDQPSKLNEWQKPLRSAMDSESLPYVESTQNK